MKTLTLEGHTPPTIEPDPIAKLEGVQQRNREFLAELRKEREPQIAQIPADGEKQSIVQPKRWSKMRMAVVLLAFSCTAPLCIGAVSYFGNFHATSIAACVFLATSVAGLCLGLAAQLGGWGKGEE